MSYRGYPRFIAHRHTPLVRGVQSDIPSQQAEQPLPAQTQYQPDIEQFARIRANLARAPAHAQRQWAEQTDSRVPKVRMANRSIRIAAANVAQIVMNQNLHRSLFMIGNNTGATLLFNFGPPSPPGSGIPLPNLFPLTLSGLACPVDEVWVTSSVLGAIVTAFEGIPSR